MKTHMISIVLTSALLASCNSNPGIEVSLEKKTMNLNSSENPEYRPVTTLTILQKGSDSVYVKEIIVNNEYYLLGWNDPSKPCKQINDQSSGYWKCIVEGGLKMGNKISGGQHSLFNEKLERMEGEIVKVKVVTDKGDFTYTF